MYFYNLNVRLGYMKCPDCGSEEFKKNGAFYTCGRCGLSAKPWDLEKARTRARDEIRDLENTDPEKASERKRKERLKYRNWYEGRQSTD